MKCLIIAAGKGSRLRQLGDSKPLVPVLGVPLIERAIRSAIEAGADDFYVVTGYQGERMARSISGTQSTGIRGLLSPHLRNLLPLPAAMIRHFILPLSISAFDEGFGHAMGLVIRELAWGVFAEVGR